MKIEIVGNISSLDQEAWNRLGGGRYPFLRHEFLQTAEDSGCISPESGWTPCHVALFDKQHELRAAIPLYEKTHSWGEFVFDWAWAQAYERAGLDYYPKLVSATPFTPAASRRILLLDDTDSESAELVVQAMLDLAGASEFSSLHVQFPHVDELPLLEKAGFKLRKDCQFHWHNHNYKSFDDFLKSFSSKKRKKARRDRRRVFEQGISFRWLHGNEIDSSLWQDIYSLISTTFLRRGSMPYFNLEFFIDVSHKLPRNIAVVLAERNHEVVATAIFFIGDDTLYGRYWGSDGHYDALHFEACYHQGIEYCIDNQLKFFEPGTQGEHKISRGFVPVSTWSAHWLKQPEFFDAIGHYLDQEQQHIDDYVDAVQNRSPYRKDTPKGTKDTGP